MPLLEFFNLSKSFFGVPVLKEVSFAVERGHLLGLVGENGAGKSTLMNLLGGNHRPDGGVMRFAAQAYAPRHSQDATAAGIAFIHQELNLFPNLSIAENIFLTSFPRFPLKGLRALIDRRGLRQRATHLLQRVGLHLPPEMRVERLSAGERQLVEVAKALSIEPRLLILDEPTTSLSARETEHLFALLGQLRSRGLTMIYISHNLDDVLRLCDDLVVLRDGAVVGAGVRADFTKDRLVSLMVGRHITQLFPPRTHAVSEGVVFEVIGLAQPGVVKDICFSLRQGEVLGLAGLMGSGRSELARILFGVDPCARGELRLRGQPIRRPGPRENIRRGLAFLTENRREEGLCLEASIADNIALVSLPAKSRHRLGLIQRSVVREAVRAIRAAVRLTPSARDEQPVKTLSGGNQQKVVLAKWLLTGPSVFILDEPTRGIDVGAKYEIYKLINDLAAQGAAVLLISSEIEELIGLCDRILVMNRGEIRAEFTRAQFEREAILCAELHERGTTPPPV